MLNVLLTVHLIACTGLVILVMLQRSEGGALGMSGGGTGGFISGRGAADVLVRTTMILAAVFFVTSLAMTRFNSEAARAPTAVDRELDNLRGGAFTPAPTPSPADSPTPVPTIDPLAPVFSPAPATAASPGAAPAPTQSPIPTPVPGATATPAPSPTP